MTAALPRAALLLSLVVVLIASVCGQFADYSVVYSAQKTCDLATDGAGAVYVLLCEGGGVARLNASGALEPTYLAQYSAAIGASTAIVRPLYDYRVKASASGRVWTLDPTNAQLVGVANVTSPTPTVSVLRLVAERSSNDFSVAPDSEALWLVFPGDPIAPVQQLSPSGAVLQSWTNLTVPGLVDYVPLGVFAAAGGSVYISGCYPFNSVDWYSVPGLGFAETPFQTQVQGCDVRHFSANGTLLQTFRPASLPTPYYNVSFLTDMAVDAAGSVYALDSYHGAFYHWASNGTQLANRSNTPFFELAITPSGVLYAGTAADQLSVVTVNTASLTALVSFAITDEMYSNEQSVALSPDGRVLYTTSASGNRVLALNASTGATLGYLGVGLLFDSQWLATDSAGNVYVSDSGIDVVYKFASNGTLLLTITGTPTASFVHPQGLAVNPTTGELVVVNPGRALLMLYSADGVYQRSINTSLFLTVQDNPQTDPSSFTTYRSNPLGVAVSATGTIVYTDLGLNDVVVIPASGNATSLKALISYDLFLIPYAVAISNDDRIFVSCEGTLGVYAFSMAGQLVTTLLFPAEGLFVNGLTFDAALNRLYGAVEDYSQIIAFSAVPPPAVNGSLCALFYGLPGNVDYPWSDCVAHSEPRAADTAGPAVAAL